MARGCGGVSSSKLGTAFACVIGAGVASVLGGLVIIAVRVKNDLFLAASLAFAAGVMLYISLVDIFSGKAVGHFSEAGFSDADSFTFAAICFFGGFPISWVLDKIADRLAQGGLHHPHVSPPALSPTPALNDKERQPTEASSAVAINLSPAASCTDVESGSLAGSQRHVQPQPLQRKVESQGTTSDEDSDIKKIRSRKLVHMGILAAMAVALHNMPEGLVTFVGYMDSVGSGITTTVAIAIHNIPEGMVIASAVYFGTGMRGKAILWASLAAFAEPLGGLIGLAVVCGGSLTPTVFGILFGLTAGIMTYISVKELLPGARNFDPDDRITTTFLTIGMIIMALSLVAIGYSAPESGAPVDELASPSPYTPPASPVP